MPAVRPGARLRQGAAAGHSPGHRPRRPIGSSCGHPAAAGRATDMADHSCVRSAGHLQFNVTAYRWVRTWSGRRRPSGGHLQRQASDYASGQPATANHAACASWPLTGQHGNAHAPFGNPSRYQHRDPSVVTPAPLLDAETSTSLVPRPMPAVVSGVHHGRHDRTGVRTAPARSCPAGHRPLHPARHGEPEATRTGNGRRHGRRSDILDRHNHKAAHRDTPARRWQYRQRDRNHGSDQAAAWCRSTAQAAPRRTAVLGEFRVERRSNGEASSVMHTEWRRQAVVGRRGCC
jgi:hypothetical protein